MVLGAKTALRALNTDNMHRTIPDDVLWNIFCQNTPEATFDCERYSRNLRGSPPDWVDRDHLKTAIYASQVCHTWRRVLLSSPAVWSRLMDLTSLNKFVDPEEWTELLLQRCNCRPIYLYGDVNDIFGLWCFLEVVKYSWKSIEALIVSVGGRALDSLHRVVNHPAWKIIEQETFPALFYFSLRTSFGTSIPNKDRCILLNNKNANMRYLAMSNACQLSYEPSASVFCNLRVLVIEGVDSPGSSSCTNSSFPLSMEQFFCVLEHTSLLEVLILDQNVVKPIDDLQPYKNDRKIQLPHLRHINLHGGVNTIYAVVLRLAPKLKCGYDFYFVTLDPDIFTADSLVEVLDLIRDRYVQFTTFDSICEIRLEPQCPSFLQHSDLFETNVRLGMTSRHHVPSYPFAGVVLSDDVDLSQATTLKLTFHDNKILEKEYRPFLHPLLGKFASLRSLELEYPYADTLLKQLKSQLGVRKSLDTPEALAFLPCLEALKVVPNIEMWLWHSDSKSGPMLAKIKKPLVAVFELCKLLRGRGNTKFKRMNMARIQQIAEREFLLSLLEQLEGLEVVICDEGKEQVRVCGGCSVHSAL